MTDATPEWKPVCVCGETGDWTLAKHDQRDFPFPDGYRLGYEVPIFITHADRTRHLIQGGRLVE